MGTRDEILEVHVTGHSLDATVRLSDAHATQMHWHPGENPAIDAALGVLSDAIYGASVLAVLDWADQQTGITRAEMAAVTVVHPCRICDEPVAENDPFSRKVGEGDGARWYCPEHAEHRNLGY